MKAQSRGTAGQSPEQVRIKSALKELRRSMAWLASEMGVSRHAVWEKLVKTQTITAGAVAKMAEVLERQDPKYTAGYFLMGPPKDASQGLLDLSSFPVYSDVRWSGFSLEFIPQERDEKIVQVILTKGFGVPVKKRDVGGTLKEGQIIFVAPMEPVSVGDDIFFYLKEDVSTSYRLGHFDKNGDAVYITQFGPKPKKHVLKKDDIAFWARVCCQYNPRKDETSLTD